MTSKTKTLFSAVFISLLIATFGVSQVHADHHGGKGDKMKMMDADGDGSVTKEEFMQHKEKRFMSKDENGDGVLTEDEMTKQCDYKKKKDKM